MLPILLTFCWTGCLDTAGLHQGEIDSEKNYRKGSAWRAFSAQPPLRKPVSTALTHLSLSWNGWGGLQRA